MMVERNFCEACATALRRKLASDSAVHMQGIREPDWYRLLLAV